MSSRPPATTNPTPTGVTTEDNVSALTGEATAATSSRPAAEVTESGRVTTTGTASTKPVTLYLQELSIDERYITLNAEPTRNRVATKINFSRLRQRIEWLLFESFKSWDKLRELLLSRVPDVNRYIGTGCLQLSCAFIYVLYSHLRNVTSQHDSANYDIYSKRCSFDYKTPLPSAIIHLIKQFGIGFVKEYWKTPRCIHRWDDEDKKGYGIPSTVGFDAEVLDGFLEHLRTCGTTFDKLPPRTEARTMWDTLFVTNDDPNPNRFALGGTFNVYTTLPLQNYNLPFDMFIAIGLCGPTLPDDPSGCPLEFSGPRIQAIKSEDVNKTVTSITSDETGVVVHRAKRSRSIGIVSTLDPKDAHPCIPFQSMLPQGIELHKQDPKDPRIWIYGRGNDEDVMIIDSVGRDIDCHEVITFFRHFFRHGI